MSLPLLEAFLFDVFDVFHLGEIKDLHDIIDFETQSLSYSKLYENTRIKTAMCFCDAWHHVLGIYPSRFDVYDFFAHHKDVEEGELKKEHAMQYIAQNTFVKYVANHDTIFSRISNIPWSPLSPSDMHTFLIKKLYTRYGKYPHKDAFENKRLMQEYKNIINDMDFVVEAQKINKNNLLSLNPITRFYVDTPRRDFYITGVCCELDCARYVLSHDNNFGYRTFNKIGLFNVAPTTPKFWTNEQVNMTILSEHQKLAEFCIPTWFDTAIILNPNPSAMNNLGVKKNLIILTNDNVSNVKKQYTIKDTRYLYDDTKADSRDYILPVSTNLDIAKSLFKLHLQYSSPYETCDKTTANNALVAWDRIAQTYFSRLPVYNKMKAPSCEPSYALLLVDNRANIFSVMSIIITLSNLKESAWAIHIVTRDTHSDWYKSHLPFAHVSTDTRLEETPFNIETYNLIMKDAEFWKQFTEYKRILVVQDDGMIVRKGLEAKFIKYDYVGAPWIHNRSNEELIMMNRGHLVGNGGLSLRNPKVMADICTQFQKIGNQLFNDQLQPIPEDVFFSHCIAVKMVGKAEIPTNNDATEFAIEQVYNSKALGFHKFWCYLPLHVINAFFDGI